MLAGQDPPAPAQAILFPEIEKAEHALEPDQHRVLLIQQGYGKAEQFRRGSFTFAERLPAPIALLAFYLGAFDCLRVNAWPLELRSEPATPYLVL